MKNHQELKRFQLARSHYDLFKCTFPVQSSLLCFQQLHNLLKQNAIRSILHLALLHHEFMVDIHNPTSEALSSSSLSNQGNQNPYFSCTSLIQLSRFLHSYVLSNGSTIPLLNPKQNPIELCGLLIMISVERCNQFCSATNFRKKQTMRQYDFWNC